MNDVVARVRGVAARDPDAPAILEDGRVALTYGALVAHAAALAARLRDAGAGPERVVALAMEKSPEWIVGMLGAWWCGAAWTPLDPSLPAARRRHVLETADVRLSVFAPRRGRPEDAPSAVPVALDAPPADPVEPVAIDSASLAYVIFTSGSTGQPKGVAVTHAGLVPMLDAQIGAFALSARARSLWVLSTAFDASVSDVGTALLAGASLSIERDAAHGPDALLETIARRGITHADLPPALLAKMDPARAPACLATVIIGGEACAVDAVRAWARRVRLVNVYGPTEATVCTSLGVCDPDRWDRPLLGRPLPGVTYRVVDDELWIGGRQLARGYLGAPALDAARFKTLDGARMFRTGDRVREAPDGQLEHLGRVDRQVKVRGILVAPEEVEARLVAHPLATRAAVLKRRVGARDALVAFLEAPPRPRRDWVAHLEERLPAWMIPARFEHVTRLPETSSGKVDLAALAERPLSPPARHGEPPATASERAIAALFEETLGVGAVSLDDDFEALGGDSLALVELVAAAAREGLPLGPELVAGHPTVRGLAAAIDRGDTSVMTMDALRRAAAPPPPLAAAIAAARARPAPESPPRRVLVTGATGFLGAHLLRSLRARTGARLVCLVRDPRRLDASVDAEIVVGDLRRPRLGLTDATWSRLGAELDAVVHCGALVSLAASFDALRATNLDGTREVLRLACEGRPKTLHHVSTLSVFVSTDRDRGVAREDDDLAETREVHGGYAQSKVAAELALRHADGALPIAQHRLGLLTGARDGGPLPANDWLALTVRGLARLGAAPREEAERLAFDVTPVDHAADAVAGLVLAAFENGIRTHHVAAARPATLAELVAAMRAEGAAVDLVDVDTFRARLAERDLVDAATRLALTRALAPCRERRAMDLFQATGIRFDDRVARGAGIVAPAPDPELLRAYVRRMLAGP